MRALRSGLLLLCCAGSASGGMPGPLRSVGWYRTDAPWPACVPPEQVPWDSLTHICIDSPTIAADYTASCVQSAETKKVAAMARQHGVKPVWIIDESVFPCSWCAAGQTDYNRTEMRNQTQRRNFLRTIGQAAEECGIEGIDADYEGWDDPGRADTSCKGPDGGSGKNSSCDRDVCELCKAGASSAHLSPFDPRACAQTPRSSTT